MIIAKCMQTPSMFKKKDLIEDGNDENDSCCSCLLGIYSTEIPAYVPINEGH
jgi:hypothetical protein